MQNTLNSHPQEHLTGPARRPVFRENPSLKHLARMADGWESIPVHQPTSLNQSASSDPRVSLEMRHHIELLRTRIQLHMNKNDWRSLAIASPTAGCGKSSIALEIAHSLSQQADVRVVLLDFDFRRPSLAHMIGVAQTVALDEFIRGADEFPASARRLRENLAFAGNSAPASCDEDFLQSRHVPLSLASIQEQFQLDIVVIDTPPLLESPDFLKFAVHVDCALLIAEAEKTTVQEIDLCEREIAAQTNMLGVVLNKCRHMDKHGGYYT